ncbi:class I SAM-dependent methyltransferase [Phaeobacter sp.]|uniref:class I SAM-dependent methyltransferase n=1 Tax=Phaeobacter sp. TaxID=1902409 RepID=UPI0025F2519C|nr:class I SAM-dependent methyltransferase [Phaeobacter sp.]
MTSLLLPTTPNNPLVSAQAHDAMGPMQLRENTTLHFIENAAFDPSATDYDPNYENSQAHSKQFLAHMAHVHDTLKARYPAGSKLVEVGCGKGDFLELAQTAGHFQCKGYDTTYDGSAPFIEKRYLTAQDKETADIVVLRHVLEHIPQPHKFLSMLAQVFGAADIYIEVPNLDWILQNNTFFDITYEHVNYFSQHALAALFDQSVKTAELCFDEQYQFVIASLSDLGSQFPTAYDAKLWRDLSFDQLFPQLETQIDSLTAAVGENGRCFLWGAATKGCMFLLHADRLRSIGRHVPYAIDINPKKQGRWLPGSKIAIRAPEAFFEDAQPGDVLAIANPAYQNEITAQLAARELDFVKVCCI